MAISKRCVNNLDKIDFDSNQNVLLFVFSYKFEDGVLFLTNHLQPKYKSHKQHKNSMKNVRIASMVALLAIGFACEKESVSPEYGLIQAIITNTSSRQTDDGILKQLVTDINTLSTSVACTDANQWKTTAIGSKACGGPTGYIAYHNSINEKNFLEKVAYYTAQQKLYNEKHQIVSTCNVEMPPKGIKCENNKTVLVY
jgi:hypothetical protein